MDAIIIAGGHSDPKDPLFAMTQGGYKALMPIAHKPMVQWVLNALGDSPCIEQIVLIGLPSETSLTCARPVTYLPDHGSILRNVRAGAEALLKIHPDPDAHALSISADVPSITSECIDWMVKAVSESKYDIYYSVVERQVMENRFPGSRRTYVHLKGLEVCGGDVNAIRLGEAIKEHELVERLTANRKNPIKQASLIGFGTLFLLLTRQLGIQPAVNRISKKLELHGRAIINPYAEVAMDVDKPFQFELMEKELLQRG